MILETERLLIRPLEPEDEATFVRFFGDPDFMSWSLDGALRPDAAKEKFRGLVALYETRGFSKLAVLEKKGSRLIGYCGFGFEPIDGEPSPELGYRLATAARGNGYATEAARAVVADAFTRLNMPFVHALVMEENMPSRRVLEKVGLSLRGEATLYGRALLHYRLEAPE